MKKTFALLMLAAMLLSTGCGNNAMDGAKKDAQEAAQKVEQKADEVKKDAEAKAEEVKQDAAAKVDEAKDKAAEMKSDAEAKADEMKSDASAKVDEMKSDVEQKMQEVSEGAQKMRESVGEISLNGIFPSMSVDEVKAAYGEPVQTSGEELVFENGAIVNVDTNNMVKSIRLTTSDVETPKGVAVGMSEYSLNDSYGPADEVRKITDGAEYEYHLGKDKVSKLIFTARNGVISEIESEFNK